jgi:hypothetical protein
VGTERGTSPGQEENARSGFLFVTSNHQRKGKSVAISSARRVAASQHQMSSSESEEPPSSKLEALSAGSSDDGKKRDKKKTKKDKKKKKEKSSSDEESSDDGAHSEDDHAKTHQANSVKFKARVDEVLAGMGPGNTRDGLTDAEAAVRFDPDNPLTR